MKFTTKVQDNNEYIKDTSDNTLFKKLQVDDVSKVTDKNTTLVLDSDGIVWKACANVESLYIVASHKSEDISVELSGIKQFKGLGKKISVDSWLGVENVKREVEGKLPLSVADFVIEQNHRLKDDSEDKAFEDVKIGILTKLKRLRVQFGINNIKMVLGEGECFRHNLPLVKAYKGSRSELRPILLKRTREWVMNNMEGIHAPKGFEGDDVVEWYGTKGYTDYKKNGIFSYVVCAEDKDALSNPKMLINFGTHIGDDNPLQGKFKFPKPYIIPDSSVSVGELDLVLKTKKELKGTGLKWLIAQAFLIGDTADNYNALKHLPQKTKYADIQAYEDFANLKTPIALLQKVVKLYFNFFPYGVQYTDHTGKYVDVSTLEYMNTYFKVAYMTRSQDDKLTFTKLCNAFKVDLSCIKDNNKLTPPIKTFNKEIAEKSIVSLRELCDDTLNNLKSYKSLKKQELVDKLDKIYNITTEKINIIESCYEMKQKEKIF